MANPIAQINTRPSPIFKPTRSVIVSKYKPAVAMDTPITAFIPGLFFSSRNENNGTNTTLNPVIKPALDEEVCNSPIV